MIRIADVESGSIAADLAIPVGTVVLRINGAEVRDSLDLLFLQSDARLEVDARGPDGGPVLYEIEKHPDEGLGLIPEPDKVRRCTNACPFCFVKGNPKADKLRSTLYIKDDDYRLSFLHGHYVTLTNLREEDWERIFAQRLSPLYVSVHSTDPDVRREMLVNPRSARIVEDLDRLERGDIRYHAQVVLCPGVNDGEALERTMEDLWARREACLSLSVVPVGLTAYNADRGVRAPTPAECRRTLERIDALRRRAREEAGTAWCYASDELFLQAGREVPGTDYFDDRDLVANGVGAISALRDRVRADLPALPSLHGTRIVLVTGTSMGPILEELGEEVAGACGAEIATVVRENSLYGPSVTTAGLLPGSDHLEALRPFADFDLALLSRTALDAEEAFLDDLSLEDLRRSLPDLEICPSDHVTDVLLRA